MPTPNTVESVTPLSGQYSCMQDMRLNAWLLVTILVYLPALYLVKHHPEWPQFAKALLAVAPFAPGLLYVRSWFRFVRGMDELQRRAQTEAFLFAALGTVALSTALNALRASGVEFDLFRHGLGLGGVFTTMIILWTVGTVLANRRYK